MCVVIQTCGNNAHNLSFNWTRKNRAPATPEMAVKLSAAFATEAEFWVNLQAQHDLWTVRRKLGKPKVKSLVSRKVA